MTNNFNFHQLNLFYRVVQAGSFSRAAEELFISQPAISAQVRDFETALELKLLERVGRTFQLTAAGNLVYQHAHQIFAQVGEMERAMADLKGLVIGQLTLASSTTVGECILPQALGQFKATYPGIELKLHIANTTQVVERVLAREFDLGFVGEEVTAADLVVEPFYQDEIVLFVGLSHPLAAKTEITLPELLKLNLAFVTREKGSATRKCAEKTLSAIGLQPNIAMELGSNEAVKRAVMAGLGAGMLSACTLVPEVRAGMVRIIEVQGLKCLRQFSYIYRQSRTLLTLERCFLEVMLKSLDSSPF